MENFLLTIGAMKSGTTSLYKYLEDHPELAVCRKKEPNFFSHDEIWNQGWDSYVDLWDWDPAQHKVAFESSTSYTKLPLFANAAERIATIPKKFKFIYILRNPIERIESHFNHGQAKNWNTTVNMRADGMVDDQLLAVSCYAKQIDEYYKRFPAEDIKIILFDDLISRPEEIVKEVCEFSGIDTNYSSPHLGKVFNQNKVRIENKVIKKIRWSKPGRLVASVVPDSVRLGVKSMIGKKSDSHFRFTEQQREEIIDMLRPDLVRLKTEYGVNINCWGVGV